MFYLVGLKKRKISFLVCLEQNGGHLPFSKNWDCLPFSKYFHISSSWVRIRLHTKNPLPSLPWTALNVTDNNTNPTKVVLSCFGLLVGLWQLFYISRRQQYIYVFPSWFMGGPKSLTESLWFSLWLCCTAWDLSVDIKRHDSITNRVSCYLPYKPS